MLFIGLLSTEFARANSEGMHFKKKSIIHHILTKNLGKKLYNFNKTIN